jgi:uncharacterized membrane protein YphA (DoxX/SURF4 family)
MNPRPSFRSRASADRLAVLTRWLLGAAFVYLGLSKALHPVDFLKLVRQYELVQSSLPLNAIAIVLPWFEVFCGLLLLAGVAVRGTALLLILMLVPFTVVVVRRALVLQAARHIPFCAVKFDCGCGTGEVFICRKVLENLVFLGLSFWLLAGHGRKWCVRHALR